MKLIYIEWEDARSNHEWNSGAEVKEWAKTNCTVKNVGWVFEETKDYILLVSSIADGQFNHDEDTCYGNMIKVPTPWIRKRKVIKL